MTTLRQVADDLAAFDSDDSRYISEWDDAARRRYDQSGDMKKPCAYISYGDPCGFADAGKLAYVNNGYSDKHVTATVRVEWYDIIDGDRGSDESEVPLVGGRRKLLGCTLSPNSGRIQYSYSVVGCVID